MGDVLISDIRQFERADGSLPPGRDGRLARFLGEIVSAGSLLAVNEFQTSDLHCRRRPNRRPCPGRINLGRLPDSDDIHWACTVCDNRGVITNWQQTKWDLSLELARGHIVSLSAERARRAGRSGPEQLPLKTYDLEVELVHAPLPVEEPVLRRIRADSGSSLEELHRCLLQAFDRQQDQPYEFMFGAPYEPDTRRYVGPANASPPEGELWEAQITRLGELQLELGETFGYLFNFNDEWVHRVVVVGIRETQEAPSRPRLLERLGASPPEKAEDDNVWDETVWEGLDSAYPLTSLYGPYSAEEGPDPDSWLSLDDLERQLLVMEAHTHSLPADHPPLDSLLLHALLHDMAETQLAECKPAARQAILLEHPLAAQGRHAVIHALGRQMALRLLAAPPTGTTAARRLPRRRKRTPSDLDPKL